MGWIAAFGILLALVPLAGGCRSDETELVLGGGPRGGTFENIADGLSEILNEKLSGVRVVVAPSGGSVANLLDLERGELSMGLVFAGDAYLGRQGRLKEGLPPTTRVLALARLYGATAHLVVSPQSPIGSVPDLRGRRVAIGGAGSGSAQAARRYFEHLGVWDSLIPIHVGYSIGMEDLHRGNIDAVWLQVGYPSAYLLELTAELPVRFLDLFPAETEQGFFTAFPFYSPARIPAHTYRGQKQDVLTFQDAALWVAGPELGEEFVYRSLQAIFSEEGTARMRAAHTAAWDLEVGKGLAGIDIPLHPGAERFWAEQGVR